MRLNLTMKTTPFPKGGQSRLPDGIGTRITLDRGDALVDVFPLEGAKDPIARFVLPAKYVKGATALPEQTKPDDVASEPEEKKGFLRRRRRTPTV